MKQRNIRGATLGLTVALVFTIILIGAGLFYLTRILGGGKQCANATDAGALTAARSLLAVTVPVNSLAPEFQGFGVDVHTGAPVPNNGGMNIFAYNRAAGCASLVAMNAIEDGTDLGKQNASRLIKGAGLGQPGLYDFGNALNKAILAAGQMGNKVADDFKTTAAKNNVNMMGPNTTTNLEGDLNFRAVLTGSVDPITQVQKPGKANVYFNSVLKNDPMLKGMCAQVEDGSTDGTILSIALPNSNANSYEVTPTYETSQPLAKAYQAVAFNDPALATSPIFFTAVNPASQPHLIDTGRFLKGAAQFGSAPVNAVGGSTLTRGTNKANTDISVLSSAIVGAIFNEYPITINRGYVRIHNLPSAQVANFPKLNCLYEGVDGSTCLFNNELYVPVGGGIYETNDTNSKGMPVNPVFYTRLSADGPAEAQAYAAYNASVNSSGPKDPNGRNPKLDPQNGKEFSHAVQEQFASEYSASAFHANPLYPPNGKGSLRVGAGYDQLATLTDLLNITNSNAVFCTSGMYGFNPPAKCESELATWFGNYRSQQPGAAVASNLTNIEALKAEIITEYVYVSFYSWQHGSWDDAFTFTTDGGEFAHPSGSRLWSRSTSQHYAVPYDIPTAAFATDGTPYQLLNQLGQNGANCNPNDPRQWADPTSMLGKLLIRCREIAPSASVSTVSALLNSLTLPLNGYQYIYSPDGGLTLAVSASPPSILANLPEFSKPGSTLCDGNPMPQCSNVPFTNAIDHQVNSKSPRGGEHQPNMGDANLGSAPFDAYRGTVQASDFVDFQPSSGYRNLLGEMSFGNNVSANVKFWAPN